VRSFIKKFRPDFEKYFVKGAVSVPETATK
jgi:hypothetical protein